MGNEKEVWKPYPDYPFIEVSNLGRVRTKDRIVTRSNGRKCFVKGRVLKQYSSHNGYMNVHFGVNGKTINLIVSRAVATSFLLNPNNYPEVNHIDNNPKNNTVSNLEWCTKKYNLDYKKNFGTSPAQIQGRPVFAVDLKTGKVLKFESQGEAARQLHLSQGDICSVLKGLYNQTGGYWFTENESEITEEKIQEIKAKTHFLGGVIAINPKNYEVFWFKFQSEAARQLGIDGSHISNVAKGKRHKTCGYWFCYADKNAVEKARSKFGDKVANKVEKLIGES